MKSLLLSFLLLLASPAIKASVLDRVAAVVDKQVITVSEINQLVRLKFFPAVQGETDDQYRRRILDGMIAQALRYRDVERFGAQDVPVDSIESRLLEIEKSLGGSAGFATVLAEIELSQDEVKALIKRQLQVDAYIDERFSPLIFVPLEEIERYHKEVWSEQRRDRGLPVLAVGDVREEIRNLLKSERLSQEISTWTTQLRSRANVDILAYR